MTTLHLSKEKKHSVIYETDAVDSPVRSIYVMKSWLLQQQPGTNWPPHLELTMAVKVPK